LLARTVVSWVLERGPR